MAKAAVDRPRIQKRPEIQEESVRSTHLSPPFYYMYISTYGSTFILQ